jgi:hypothetical protein
MKALMTVLHTSLLTTIAHLNCENIVYSPKVSGLTITLHVYHVFMD